MFVCNTEVKVLSDKLKLTGEKKTHCPEKTMWGYHMVKSLLNVRETQKDTAWEDTKIIIKICDKVIRIYHIQAK